MEFLASLFVGKPLNILVVAALSVLGYFTLRLTSLRDRRRLRLLLVTAIVWAAYGAWEWLILVRTPEANIRVDLLVIWPPLAILSAWALFSAFR